MANRSVLHLNKSFILNQVILVYTKIQILLASPALLLFRVVLARFYSTEETVTTRGAGNEPAELETKKMERKQRIGNEVTDLTDRARVH